MQTCFEKNHNELGFIEYQISLIIKVLALYNFYKILCLFKIKRNQNGK